MNAAGRGHRTPKHPLYPLRYERWTHTAVTEKGSHTVGYGRTHACSSLVLAVTFIWGSVGGAAPSASALPVGPSALDRRSCEVGNAVGCQCWRGQGGDRAPQAATAVVMGPGGAHLW